MFFEINCCCYGGFCFLVLVWIMELGGLIVGLGGCCLIWLLGVVWNVDWNFDGFLFCYG